MLKVYIGEGRDEEIPDVIGGYKVELVEVGHVRALSMMAVKSQDVQRTGYFRPAPGGVSVGHPLVTAGTLGMTYQLGDKRYILSNCHVNAASDTVQHRKANVGDLCLQPGIFDGGSLADAVIGSLYSWRPLDEDKSNAVDWSLVEPKSQDLIKDEILDIGVPTGFKDATVNMDVEGSGRTTGLRQGKITDLDASMMVDYGDFDALFEHQIMTSMMADGGDSGKVLVDPSDGKVVGLTFSGSEYVTLHNHIADVNADILTGTIPARAVTGSSSLMVVGLGIAAAVAYFLTR